MNSLFVNSLYIFECKNKIAKSIKFNRGINVITSDKSRGNDVGKSVLLKSIYHTLGADSKFDDMWQKDIKTYIINITINDKDFYVYRKEALFKIFDKSFNRLFTTNNRQDLSKYLGDIYRFKVMLPNRSKEELELAPPVYSYLLNFIDQDHMNGSTFSSFKSLTQYSKFKETVIYTHFGAFDETYFEAVKVVDKIKANIKIKNKERLILKSLLQRMDVYLDGLDAPDSIDVLNIELDETKNEYYEIVTKLQKVKNNLIQIRNQKIDLELNLKEIKITDKHSKKEFVGLDNDIDHKILKSNSISELLDMKDELEILILECNRVIERKESEYKGLLDKLKEYEDKIRLNDKYISDVIKHKGYVKAKDDLLIELNQVNTYINELEQELDKYSKVVKTYNNKKKLVNSEYEKLMIESKEKFDLKEFSDSKFKNIGINFETRGSNKPISTIIWHFNLLKVKNVFNESGIRFPLVLDSPNNVELDDDKKLLLFKYIFKNNLKDTQLIMSTLGFNKDDYKDVEFGKIIKLENDKYELLNEDDYKNNMKILESILNN